MLVRPQGVQVEVFRAVLCDPRFEQESHFRAGLRLPDPVLHRHGRSRVGKSFILFGRDQGAYQIVDSRE
jgi:hypothetical protein